MPLRVVINVPKFLHAMQTLLLTIYMILTIWYATLTIILIVTYLYPLLPSGTIAGGAVAAGAAIGLYLSSPQMGDCWRADC